MTSDYSMGAPGNGRPSVFFLTLGCPKNEVDTDRMAASLTGSFELAASVQDADAVVVNTCSFIEAATEESIAEILGLASGWRAARPGRRLVVAGCLPSRYGSELSDSMPEVDAFVPVADEAHLLAVLGDLFCVGVAEATPPVRLAATPSAYLQVSDGCHRRCTYCTIPAIRGPYRSRDADELVAEAELLVRNGVRELVLVGQDVSAWGRDLEGEPALASLVERLARVEQLAWLRLMYVQPDGVTPELLETMAAEPTVCHYLDMPMQHASTRVLHHMGRKGSGAEYLRLIGVIRGFLPDVVLRTTLIAGFPGETEEDAEQLEAFLEDASLDYVGVFAFSPEDGTPAAEMPDQVSPLVRRERAQRLRDIADEIGAERAAAFVGRSLEVLSEGIDEEGVPVGRHRGQAPEVDGVVMLDRASAPGTIVQARISDAAGYDLMGEVEA